MARQFRLWQTSRSVEDSSDEISWSTTMEEISGQGILSSSALSELQEIAFSIAQVRYSSMEQLSPTRHERSISCHPRCLNFMRQIIQLSLLVHFSSSEIEYEEQQIAQYLEWFPRMILSERLWSIKEGSLVLSGIYSPWVSIFSSTHHRKIYASQCMYPRR